MFRHRKNLKEEISSYDAIIQEVTEKYHSAITAGDIQKTQELGMKLNVLVAERSKLYDELLKNSLNKSEVTSTVLKGLIAAGGAAAVYFGTRDQIVDKATERSSRSFLDLFKR